ncbi:MULTISPECIES: TonB-dependent receptor domain-containing protein [unclassified Phenylobacterium]|uniref:TonB-dependent receptor domain-containing protein n=1 Tax=unclassified Phenylobacterium TaxID=2640670 RepID=UPI0009E8D1AD|nr:MULTISPECIES: TonB-dependent receptor [unclassified Phenylobacterium]
MRFAIKTLWLCGAGAGALLAADAACAQPSSPTPSGAAAPKVAELEEVQVTGSRIVRDGYETPNPVTVRTNEDLQQTAPISAIAGLGQLPQFQGSSLLTDSRRFSSPFTPNGNFLNLRGIGSVRTLTLLNGVRLPPTNFLGQVDASVVPQLLLERVDVVTGGASAAYGSDAVAGVVNFILDEDFAGMKANVQGGVSSRGDRYNYRVGIAGGFALGERGHLTLSYERFEATEVKRKDREVSAQQPPIGVAAKFPGGNQGTALNPFIYVYDGRYTVTTSALVAGGPFANTYFPTAGTFRPVQGTATNTPGIFVGGDWDIQDTNGTMAAPILEQSAFARATYELTDNITGYVQGIYSTPEDRSLGLTIPLRGVTIFSGNPFIPAAFQQQMTAQNVASITINRQLHEAQPLGVWAKNRTFLGGAGLKGRLLDRFSWNLDYAYGHARHRQSARTIDLRRLAAAADAVRDPSGAAVCRVNLTNPGLYPGCVPINLLGAGAPSPEAVAYISEPRSEWSTLNETHFASAGVQGDVFNLPAGAVTLAIGAEYRDERLDQDSNADPASPLPITGLRGIAATSTRFYLVNAGLAEGRVKVKEVFGEAAVPVLKDAPLAKSLDLNGAVRYTDYSTSGGVTTWKVGATWEPVQDVRFRATRSRDIRAPNINELFAGTSQSRFPIIDPHTNTAVNVATQAGGNPNLDPEKADTLTIGAVFQPRFAPGLMFSLDYYKIKIRDLVGSVSLAETLTLCEAANGTGPACEQIVRPLPFSDRTPANAPTLIYTSSINIAKRIYSGVDAEATYRRPLGGGDLTLRLLGTYIDSIETQATPASPVLENAGYLGTPRVVANLSARYDKGIWSFFIQERLYGKVKLGGPTQVFDERDPPELWYTDVTVTARPAFAADYNGEFFLTVNNLFDPKPFTSVIQGAGGGIGNRAFEGRYDFIGRTFTAGVRTRF